jgi:translation initiation factor 2 subunit 3
VFQLTGTKTQTHSKEKTRNITIKQGYANMKIWQNSKGEYTTTNSKELAMEDHKLVHHMSFVDCPGHQSLILTMMASVSLMKGAIVVVSAAEPIEKKPQLIQHLAAAKIAGLDKLIILFNKLDLISKDKALERKEELDNLLTKLGIVPTIIIPTCLNKKIGLQNLIKSLIEVFPPNSEEVNTSKPEFRLTRTFDINKPGIDWDHVKGGILGGSLIKGNLKIGDEVEIRPGYISKKDNAFIVKPIKTIIKSIETDKINLDKIVPGGLIAIGTDIDPFFTKDDSLAGNVIGLVGFLPNVFLQITMQRNLTDQFEGSWNPAINDKMYLQIGNINTEATLIKKDNKELEFMLSKPSCIEENALIVICKQEQDVLKIVGYGNLISKKSIKIL